MSVPKLHLGGCGLNRTAEGQQTVTPGEAVGLRTKAHGTVTGGRGRHLQLWAQESLLWALGWAVRILDAAGELVSLTAAVALVAFVCGGMGYMLAAAVALLREALQ